MAEEENKKEEEKEKEEEKKEEKEEEEEEKEKEEEEKEEEEEEEEEVEEEVEEEEEEEREEKEYYEGVGRRKTSTAVVRIFPDEDPEILVNDDPYEDYFPNLEMQESITAALEKMNTENKFKISVMVKGGGLHSQAEAIRHGVARALVDLNPSFKKRLKRAGYLTRDPRMKERKKPGKRGARRSPQWQKR